MNPSRECLKLTVDLGFSKLTILKAETEELKSLLMKVKEEGGKAGLKFNMVKHGKTTIMVSTPITSWQIDGETVETVADFIFWGLQNHCRW